MSDSEGTYKLIPIDKKDTKDRIDVTGPKIVSNDGTYVINYLVSGLDNSGKYAWEYNLYNPFWINKYISQFGITII